MIKITDAFSYKLVDGYPTLDKCIGYQVQGGFFQTTFHKTLKSAETEKSLRESMISKFPFTPPASDRELAKAKKLGL